MSLDIAKCPLGIQNHPQLGIRAIDPKRHINFFNGKTKLYYLEIHLSDKTIWKGGMASRKHWTVMTLGGREGCDWDGAHRRASEGGEVLLAQRYFSAKVGAMTLFTLE